MTPDNTKGELRTAILKSFPSSEIKLAIKLIDLCILATTSTSSKLLGTARLKQGPIPINQLLNVDFTQEDLEIALTVFKFIDKFRSVDYENKGVLSFPSPILHTPYFQNQKTLTLPHGIYIRELRQELYDLAMKKADMENKITLVLSQKDGLYRKLHPELKFKFKKKRSKLLKILIQKESYVDKNTLIDKLSDGDTEYDVKSAVDDMNEIADHKLKLPKELIVREKDSGCSLNYNKYTIETKAA